jgi:hypothetical protein
LSDNLTKELITLKYKLKIVFDSNNVIYFDEWAPAVVCFFNRINSCLNELIEIYENDCASLVWVKGKGVIFKGQHPLDTKQGSLSTPYSFPSSS